MTLRPFLIAAAATSITLSPVQAQEKISTEDSGGFIVRFLEDSLSGENRSVNVVGLTGTFSSRAQIERLTIADSDGIWLELEGAELDWNRAALLRGNLSVNALSAKRIAVLRAPLPAPTDPALPTPEATPLRVPELPIAIKLGSLQVDRIELGAPLLGQDSVWSLNGDLDLADGALDSTLDLLRLDRKGDKLQMALQVGAETDGADLDLVASEAPGGLIGSLLPLPQAPRLDLTLNGTGPLSDFRADLDFAAADLAQVTGQVRIAAGDANAEDPQQGLDFSADLNGDIDALIPEVYRPFFGPDLRLRVKGEQFQTEAGAQGVALHSLAISSRALRLSGAAMVQDGALETANLRATVLPESGQSRVILPVAGGGTAVSELSLIAQKPVGNTWQLRADLIDLETDGADLDQATVTIDGLLENAPFQLEAHTEATLTGLRLSDPALSAALGPELSFVTDLLADGENLNAQNLQLTSQGLAVAGNVAVADWADGLEISSTLTTEVDALSRFAPIVGFDLSGAAFADVQGRYTPLSGAFHANLKARTQDLASGIPQLDPMIAGDSHLTLIARRDDGGLFIDDFALDAPGLTAKAAGTLSSADGRLELNARLADLAPLVPQVPGPLTIAGNVARAADVFDGMLTLQGPNSSDLKLSGTATLDGSADLQLDATLAQLERFVPQLAGQLRATGSAQREAGLWQLDLDAQGPAGVNAQVRGAWDETKAEADLRATGDLRLDVANLFIAPNLLTGSAGFDLTLRGKPGLDAVSGQIRTQGSRIVLPDARQEIDAISGDVRIANARAQLALTAAPRDGGQVRVTGPVALLPPFNSDLSINLGSVVLTDNLIYKTTLGGALRLSGALTQGPVIAGQIDVGETNINIASAGGAIDAAPIPDIRHIGETASAYQTRRHAGLTEQTSAQSSRPIALDLLINAPNRIFARGRGLRSELGGSLRIRGTANAPEPAGEINLIRGSFDILGRRLTLDDGRISLVGSLTPFLDFSASSNTSEGTATLRIAGPVNAPEIQVTAEPNRPSEEALALLLFGDNVQDLSPLALARLAASAARLSGRGLGTEEKLAEETGVDDVDLGFDNLGTGQLGLGGYAAENLYTDFNVNTRGDSELSINLDLSPSLSVSGTVDSTGETGIGLLFKRDY
ncbi:translocation/assembly module TamB [Epibacterium sp. SM1979]|uniref:Translocation/assembly module TamB n=1 Tax=Tritonibacter litoralis TaxID=2662264 RepID=A0A843YJE1_9RHOB|nr:translocation/assembly module TamB domain-containing protein [Tritonibacter litoralis]MQQ09279.1 translocation/assembly module TamB [Tritonibacter litoralis]